jgi:hypothetical protein
MALCINQSGTYRNITTLCINQSGTYRNITTGCINQSGTYRLFGFLPQPGALGSSFGGGFLICKPGSSPAWVVAPSSSQVTRNWYQRGDASTSAQEVTGCTGWFLPTCAQLQNPGYNCRTYWDTFSAAPYGSETEFNSSFAYALNFATGNTGIGPKNCTAFGRAFRCVTY